MHIINDIKLDFSDVLIRPKRSKMVSRREVNLTQAFEFLNSGQTYQGVPIIAANMDSVGTFDMARELAKDNMMTALHKHYDIEDYVAFFTKNDLGASPEQNAFLSIGILDHDLEKFRAIVKKLPKDSRFNHIPVCIDVANGYTESFVDYIKRFREEFPERTIMAGNVVTAEMTEQLLLSGADIVKVGIGPGSVCTTRKMTGVGFPQLSAVIECADAAHGLNGHICADGGCTNPGDIAKAFAGGADFVMLGGMLAGHKECNGELHWDGSSHYELEDGSTHRGDPTHVKFYGMSSDTAMKKHAGGKASYRASEGKTVLLPYRGEVCHTVEEILGGLRSTCTYVGASKLKQLSKRTTFIRVNNQINNVFTGREV